MGYELHPETPKQGEKIRDLFPELDPEVMVKRLKQSGAPYGIDFNTMELMSNSRLALEASEFAREHGEFDEFHQRTFKAYFLEGKDIGQLQTILSIAEDMGLDVALLKDSLEQGKYSQRLNQAREFAGQFQVTGLPTFIINGDKKIVGAQHYEVFAKAIKEALAT